MAAVGQVQASLAGQISADQSPRITTLPDIAATALHIGPFLTDAGHVLNDVRPVSLRLITASGQVQDHANRVLVEEVAITSQIDTSDVPVQLRVASPLGSVARTLPQQGLKP